MATRKPNPDVSVYDYMNSKGKNGSYATRKALFNDYFGGSYTGTAQQNLKLLADLKAGKISLDKAPSIKTSNTIENKTTTGVKTSTTKNPTTPRGTKVVTVDTKKAVTPITTTINKLRDETIATIKANQNLTVKQKIKVIHSLTTGENSADLIRNYERQNKTGLSAKDYKNTRPGSKVNATNVTAWSYNEETKRGTAYWSEKDKKKINKIPSVSNKNPMLSGKSSNDKPLIEQKYDKQPTLVDLINKKTTKKKINKIQTINKKVIKDGFGNVVKDPKKYYYGKPLLDYARDNFGDDVKRDLKKIFN